LVPRRNSDFIENVSPLEIDRQLIELEALDVKRALLVRKRRRGLENRRKDFLYHDSTGRRVASMTNVNTTKMEVLILGNRRNARC